MMYATSYAPSEFQYTRNFTYGDSPPVSQLGSPDASTFAASPPFAAATIATATAPPFAAATIATSTTLPFAATTIATPTTLPFATTTIATETSDTATIATISQRSVEQTQLLSNFLEAHFPVATRLERDMHRRSSFLAQIPNIDFSSPLLSSAVSSLCLAYFGTRSRDQRLLHLSQDAYGSVLNALVRALPRPQQAQKHTHEQHRDIIASILCLSLYDECTPESQRDQTNWVMHFWGALQYLESCGPSCVDLDQMFEAKMFINLRFPALVLSFARRKASLFDRPEWRNPRGRYLQGTGSSDWFPLLTPLGRLLERTDDVLASAERFNRAHVQQLHQDLANFRQPLLAFVMDEFHGGERRTGVASVAVADTAAFRMDIEEHCFIATNETFTTHHRFTGGPQQIWRCVVSWFACLLADCAVLKLLLHHPAVAAADRSLQDTERDAYAVARDLCRSVYHFSQLSSLAYAYFVEILLRLSHSFFEDAGADREGRWAEACLLATQMRIRRMERTCTPTLCRVRALAPDFALAGRYRAGVTYERSPSAAVEEEEVP